MGARRCGATGRERTVALRRRGLRLILGALAAAVGAAGCDGAAAPARPGLADGGGPGELGPVGDAGPGDPAADLGRPATDVDAAAELPPVVVRLNEWQCHDLPWVELVNTDATRWANLGGWSLVFLLRGGGGEAVLPLPPPGALGPGEHRRFGRSGEPLPPPVRDCAAVVALVLRRDDGQDVDRLEPPHLTWGQSWGRSPDAVGAWAAGEPTPGRVNRAPGDEASPLFDPFTVPTIELTLPASSVAALQADPRTEVPAGFRYLAPGESSGPQRAVRVHIKGRWGSFVPLDLAGAGKTAFKLQFDDPDPDARFHGLKKLTLNNMIQDFTMLHEVLAYTVFRAFDVPCPRTGYAWLRVNGHTYGLYLDLETYDDVLLARFFATTGHLYDGRYGADFFAGMDQQFEGDGQFSIEEGDPGDVSDLTRLIEVAASVPDARFVAELEQVADLAELLRMWAVEQVIGHWDGYAPTRNNFKLHFDARGLARLLPWGTDQTFSDLRNPLDGAGVLFGRCLAVPECHARYVDTIEGLLRTLDTLDLDGLTVRLAAALRPRIEADPRRPYDLAVVDGSVQDTRNFLARRRALLGEWLACARDPGRDPDGDGSPCAVDCDELDPTVHPGAVDRCGDGRDQDCSGLADDAPECPDCVELDRDGRRYLVCLTPRSWVEARAHCQEQQADLALPGDPEEDAWLITAAQQVRGGDYWLGFTDVLQEGEFGAWDGSPLTYQHFSPGQPDDWQGAEDCLGMWSDGSWNDFSCDSPLMALCEEVEPAPGVGGGARTPPGR